MKTRKKITYALIERRSTPTQDLKEFMESVPYLLAQSQPTDAKPWVSQRVHDLLPQEVQRNVNVYRNPIVGVASRQPAMPSKPTFGGLMHLSSGQV